VIWIPLVKSLPKLGIGKRASRPGSMAISTDLRGDANMETVPGMLRAFDASNVQKERAE
jgi:hypothetical protein